MTLWRLEWLRLTRTRRLLALVGVFVFFGVIGPLTARYLSEIVERFGAGIEIDVPEPVASDGMIQYVDGGFQLGLLTAVIVAAGALAIDAKPEIGVFFRTRVPSMRRILTPRYLVTTAATVAAFFVGALAAWYETVLLLGGLPIGRTVAGLAYAALYLAFAVALVAASAGLFRTGLGAALGALAVLLGLPIVGLFPIISDWVPSHLVGSTTGLLALGEPASEYLRASLTTVLATAGALWLAVVLAAHREV